MPEELAIFLLQLIAAFGSIEHVFVSDTRLAGLREQSTERLHGEYARLDALESSARAQRLLVLAVLDERGIDPGSGAVDTAGWVAAQSQLSRSTASSDVAVARSLANQPAIADVALEGRMSRDQLVPLAKVATPETDAQWAEQAPSLSPGYLAREARKRRIITTKEAAAHLAAPALWWRSDPHAGRTKFYGDLPNCDAAKVVRALERKAEQVGKRDDGTWAPFEERCADAFVALASQALSRDADPDRACVVIHAPVDALCAEEAAGCELPDLGVGIASETARRLACDANVQWIAHALDGTPLGIGRRTRKIPRWLDRLVRYRDGHCRFPGCDRRRGAQVHHIVHWTRGGPTDIDNLVLLCPRHHTFVHEYQWGMRGNPSLPGDLVFTRPDGREYRPPDRGSDLALAA